MKIKDIVIIILALFILVLLFFISQKNSPVIKNDNGNFASSSTEFMISDTNKDKNYSDVNVFEFNDFHGSKNISRRFKFFYPKQYLNDGNYFSPQKIEYYDLYSVSAPIYFDLIRSDIFNDTEFKYQIDQSKRKSPDKTVKIDNQDFKKYDLIDYGTYGGDSAGRVIVYVGPKIKIDDIDYTLVFHYEEKPLTLNIQGNDPRTFEQMVESIKFY